VTLKLPVLGGYSETWPLDCPKTDRIVRANADYIASVAGEDGKGLTGHNLYNGWAILMLLSTGEQQDLDVVRKVYRARMAGFEGEDTGSHTWHNGLQGLAVCEYYLRTGDKTVMPLIDAICRSAAKYEVMGGWSHWAKGVNPQYVAGGLLNAAGTQVLTTLLLARLCGADVDEQTLLDSLTFFYRFAGRGSNPYGDHRPENGYGSNNGKTEMLALAMGVAARAEGGELYAMARDKSALTALYDYPHMLQGHTGGLGALWYGVAAALMAEKKPALYRNRLEQTRWFFELSRRHDGSFGASGTGRYDQANFGYAVGLSLTAPRKTLQITGAPKSPHARAFTLPARPWGREADRAFFSLDGGSGYKPTGDPPHLEIKRIADADEAALRGFASHPEHVYREHTADAIREKRLTALTERLLRSDDPLARHTACMVINRFEPWGLRFSVGTRSRYSLGPDAFTPALFEGLMAIVTDPAEPLWLVDQALLASAAATADQVRSRLDDILPFLGHEEWWLQESACIALTPAMKDERVMARVVPALVEVLSTSMHARPRGTMTFMIDRAVADAPESVRQMVDRSYLKVYEQLRTVPDPEPGVDHSGITSFALESTLAAIVATRDPGVILRGAELTTQRIDDLRDRELHRQIEMLIAAADHLDAAGRQQLGTLLAEHYRPAVVGDDAAALRELMASGKAVDQLNKLVKIDALAGRPSGWRVFGRDEGGRQQWWHTSFDPADRPADSEQNRYREVAVPDRLADWYRPDYRPGRHGWLSEDGLVAPATPDAYDASLKAWWDRHLRDAGEVVFIRKTFELDDLDDALFRLTVYARQGYDVYLNGQLVASERGRSKTWQARRRTFDAKMREHLKVGTNVIAVRSFLQYFRGKDGGVDVFVEGLRELPPVE